MAVKKYEYYAEDFPMHWPGWSLHKHMFAPAGVFSRYPATRIVWRRPVPVAMKAMKAKKPMTASEAYSSVAKTTGLKPKDVKACVDGIMVHAAAQIKKTGSFNVANMLNLDLKVKPATKGLNRKSKPASKTIRAGPTIKFEKMVN